MRVRLLNRVVRGGFGLAQIANLLVRVVLAGLFIYAGVIKLMKPDLFLVDIESYRLVPYSLAWLTAFYLPPLEIICGLSLLLPRLYQPATLILLGLMLVFLIAIISAWARGLDISCGCFGVTADATNYVWLVGRDFLFLIALLFVLRRVGLDVAKLPSTVLNAE